MNLKFIVIGDKTTHGGTVISADFTSDINGKYMARINDMTVCPKCKGRFPITSGASDMVDGAGMGYARETDTTACGAKLVSGQQNTSFWGSESSSGNSAAVAGPANTTAQATPAAVAAQSPTLCLECLATAAARGDGIVARG